MTISNTFTATAVEDGITYQIETTVGSVTFPADTQQITLATANISFYYKEGSAAREALSCYSCAFLKRGTSYERITDTSKYTRAYNSKGTSAGIRNLTLGTSDNAIVICIYSNPTTAHSGYLAELEIPIYKQGNTGARGKMSRNPYYAGKMSEIGGTQFVANDYSTPYVDVETGTEDHPVCYIYVGSNGTQTFPSTVQAYSESPDWEVMNSSFKYIIMNMLFTSFARMGSWVINGDFLYSAKGFDSNDVERTYEKGGAYVFIGKGNQNNTYTPNIWMDSFSGEVFFVKGTIGGFTIGKHYISSLNDKIILQDDGAVTLGKMAINSNGDITVSDITANDGSFKGTIKAEKGITYKVTKFDFTNSSLTKTMSNTDVIASCYTNAISRAATLFLPQSPLNGQMVYINNIPSGNEYVVVKSGVNGRGIYPTEFLTDGDIKLGRNSSVSLVYDNQRNQWWIFSANNT